MCIRDSASGDEFEAQAARWRTMVSDVDATFDKTVVIDAARLTPFLTWGTNPAQVVALSGVVPSPEDFADADTRAATERSLAYMGLTSGTAIRDVAVDVVFIGSCTNSRIEDLRAAAAVADGHRVKDGVRALVVPGSHRVKKQAEAEGLDNIFRAAGFEWREPGLSLIHISEPTRPY